MPKSISLIVRVLLALAIGGVGVYLLWGSVQEWYESGFTVFTFGRKGKDEFSGVLFGIVFISYGAWELFNVFRRVGT